MINSRDSYIEFNPNKKEIIEVPYRIGTVVKMKKDENILARICQYRITVINYRLVIKVGLSSNIYDNDDKIDYEILIEELNQKWKDADKMIVGRIDHISDFSFKDGLESQDIFADKVEKPISLVKKLHNSEISKK